MSKKRLELKKKQWDKKANIKVKRLLALLKAEAEYPNRKFNIKLPIGFRRSFESQKNFRGWINYHVTWDVTRKDPWTILPRNESLVAEWHRELAKIVPVISSDGIHEA